MGALSRAHLSSAGTVMLDLYTARSPVVFKVLIALEEMGLSFRSIPLDVTKGEQYSESFAAINPNARIPALVDHAPADGGPPIALAESGAILVYLAEKTGQFLATAARQRAEVLQWVFWQMASLGPTMGQTRHFLLFARERCPYAIERFSHEAARLYGVLDKRLTGRDYSVATIRTRTWRAGPGYSIRRATASIWAATPMSPAGSAGGIATGRGARRADVVERPADRDGDASGPRGAKNPVRLEGLNCADVRTGIGYILTNRNRAIGD